MKNIMTQSIHLKKYFISHNHIPHKKISKKTHCLFSTLLLGSVLSISHNANAEGHNAQPNYPYFIIANYQIK